MGSAPSSQRGGKAAQSGTAPREPTDANMPTDTAQAANMTKDHLTTSNPEDPKKGTTAPSKHAAVLISSTTCVDGTNFAVKFPQHATGVFSDSGIPSTGPPNPPADAVHLFQPPEAVTSPYTQDVPKRALALDRNVPSTGVEQTNTGNPKVDVRPQKRSRRGRGRGKDKDADVPALEETENIPPPATHQRRARRPGRARTGARPVVKRGRSETRAGRIEATDSKNIAVTRLAAKGVGGDSKFTSRSANTGRTRDKGRRPSAGFHSNSKAPDHLPGRARAGGANVLGALTTSEPVQNVFDGETLEVAKANQAKTDFVIWTDMKDKAVPVEIAPPNNGKPASLNESAEFPVSMAEVDVSTVPPLPSSTRRRAKEYFQRRTRERSVDAETGRPRRGATVAEQGKPTNGEEPNSRLHIAGAKKRPASWSVPGSNKNHDQFAFDPEASPFTPNATSSPRQGSLSSFGVQSFSSPTPLPPHGNRNVAQLKFVKKSGKSNTLVTIDSSSSQAIPASPHGAQGEQQGDTAYTYYAERDRAQAHLQAEHLAFMQLQAYYSWLAGNIPASVGVIRATEHMERSGGGGGLSGGVALGHQTGQVRVRGKVQSRNASGAYAHPKEHVVFSPREHERAQLAPGVIFQRDGRVAQAGVMEPGKDESDSRPEAEAQRTNQKWDGSWGLREGHGREVGWDWGRTVSSTGM